ncbi:MAG TPA: NAD(P)H-dependent oxidoreductase [Gemmatimonadaceae bacterium]|nr:NAD(P)H-dependent oxidoreductase [Gemmatimonadaceae bacterium]
MLLLQIVTVSTRRGRLGPHVAKWFAEQARAHRRFAIEEVDLAELNLPLLDEPRHPRFKQYDHDHTKAWSTIVDRADAFAFVTPEYDYSAPASLMNALQYLFHEWTYKPAGFVSYGGVSGGTRGVQMSKLLVTSLKMMPMFEAVAIPFFARNLNAETGVFDPGDVQVKAAATLLDELLKWATALKTMR